MTKEEVAAPADAKIADIEVARTAMTDAAETAKSKAKSPEKLAKVQQREDELRDKADARIKYLDSSVADAKAERDGRATRRIPRTTTMTITFKSSARNGIQRKDPVHVAWLPGFANDRLNAALERMKDNAEHFSNEPKRLAIGVLSVLPQVLFVVMPLFALLLKIFFIFKRRLYMEHLIIALHSHAFIFLRCC